MMLCYNSSHRLFTITLLCCFFFFFNILSSPASAAYAGSTSSSHNTEQTCTCVRGNKNWINVSDFCISYQCSGSMESTLKCFSGDSTVEINMGSISVSDYSKNPPTTEVHVMNKRILMRDLRVGDYVKSLCNGGFKLFFLVSFIFFFCLPAGWIPCWTKVIGFLHRNESEFSHFRSWKTNTSLRMDTVRVTDKHLVFQNQDGFDNNAVAVSVDTLHVGDMLFGGTVLSSVGTSTSAGVYAPLTLEGTLLVGNIWFSCYGNFFPCVVLVLFFIFAVFV